MKRIFLLFAILMPMSLLAHEGHGITGSEIIHLLISHYYFVIAFALVIVGSLMYRKKIRS